MSVFVHNYNDIAAKLQLYRMSAAALLRHARVCETLKDRAMDELMGKDGKEWRVTITLSEQAYKDLQETADWAGKPMASLCRDIVEDYWRSPNFTSLLRRVRGLLSKAKD